MITTLFRQLNGFEACFYIDTASALTPEESGKLLWIIAETFEADNASVCSSLNEGSTIEIGPRLSVETPFSSNAVAICQAMDLNKVRRIECSRRFRILKPGLQEEIIRTNLDQMTQEVYLRPLGHEAFEVRIQPAPVRAIRILERGEDALRELNAELGLGMDAWDIAYYTEMFRRLGRSPTDVECFQIGNANSDHSRHWFFKGRIFINGMEMSESLLDIIRAPLKVLGTDHNSILAFNDNAGAIMGHEVLGFVPAMPGKPSSFIVRKGIWHITATAETHNHPTMIAPFPGAETGTGGRIRDNSAAGRGSLPLAGAAGYVVGNLHMACHEIPGETVGGEKSLPFASPLKILIEGSNGCSSYGN